MHKRRDRGTREGSREVKQRRYISEGTRKGDCAKFQIFDMYFSKTAGRIVAATGRTKLHRALSFLNIYIS